MSDAKFGSPMNFKLGKMFLWGHQYENTGVIDGVFHEGARNVENGRGLSGRRCMTKELADVFILSRKMYGDQTTYR